MTKLHLPPWRFFLLPLRCPPTVLDLEVPIHDQALFWLTLTIVLLSALFACAATAASYTATTEDGGSASFTVTVANYQYKWEFERSENPPTLKPDASEWKVLLGTVKCNTSEEAKLCRDLFADAEYSQSGSLKILPEKGETQKALLKPEAEGTTVSFYAVVEPKYLPSGTYNIQWDGSLTEGCVEYGTWDDSTMSLITCALDLGNNPKMGAFTLEAQYAIWDGEKTVTALTMEVEDQSKQFALACNGAAIPEGVTVTWTGGDQYVAVNDGEITPIMAHAEGGSTTITAATQDGGSASFAVTVAGPTGVDCQTAVSLVQGESVSFTAKALPKGLRHHGLSLASDAPLTISDPQVEADGLHTWTLTAAKDAEPGEYTMTVTADADASVAKQITVTVSEPAPPYVPPYVPPAPAAPSSIQFTPAEDLPAGLELKQGERVTLELGVIDNYAAFAAAGVEVTAVPVCDAGLTLSASIGQEGRLTVHLSALESGEHQFTVTLSAPGCSAVNAAALAVRGTQPRAGGEEDRSGGPNPGPIPGSRASRT